LEWVVGVACLRWGRKVALVASVFQPVAVMSPVVTAIVVPADTSVVAAVVVAT
jgi:hypothetical protein